MPKVPLYVEHQDGERSYKCVHKEKEAMQEYHFKIKEEKLKELLAVYKRYARHDCTNKGDFINEFLVKRLFLDMERISKDGYLQG
jgi:hypothetical protein